MELVLKIDLDRAAPVYRQIVDGLRALLVAKAFKPGEKLPTVRQLAIDLAVNHNTVAAAYRLLAEEGWLELKRHHGAIVVARPSPAAKPRRQRDFVKRLRELASLAIAEGVQTRDVAAQLKALARNLKEEQTP
ncbi:MAG TPA: GntR family transcriptional regulator [Candidatus Baltobacteraceae bacterium]|jgi:GntR family transcriptional regulator|nr:GntR family transcriptional regulator [Candidatus Baltobacteraceae bacterium]